MLVYWGHTDDTDVYWCTDDMSVHICTLYRLSYVCIVYWGTQIILVLRELFEKINMRHFLGSLHQVSVVCTQNI